MRIWNSDRLFDPSKKTGSDWCKQGKGILSDYGNECSISLKMKKKEKKWEFQIVSLIIEALKTVPKKYELILKKVWFKEGSRLSRQWGWWGGMIR